VVNKLLFCAGEDENKQTIVNKYGIPKYLTEFTKIYMFELIFQLVLGLHIDLISSTSA
jgi:hypothetical protein